MHHLIAVSPCVTSVTADPGDRTKAIRTLNGLLRGEISATRTYGLAIPTVADRPGDVERLRNIAREHDAVAKEIRAAIESHGGTPEDSTTVWPTFSTGVTGPGKVFVEAAALKALKEGEEKVLNEYRTAIDQLNAETVTLIRDSIIPARMKHIDDLSEMIARL